MVEVIFCFEKYERFKLVNYLECSAGTITLYFQDRNSVVLQVLF